MEKAFMKTAVEFLSEAIRIVDGERQKTHGDKIKNHLNIAQLWSWYLKREVTAYDVAMLMVLLKVARTKTGRYNNDDLVDACGYASIAAEIAADNSEDNLQLDLFENNNN